jgi:ABC-2 type transport system ATP-binding protein
VIEVEGLVKRYGSLVAVDDLSFEVRQGEIFGLLGPNGAGKTTTIRVILDILQPDAGRVSVFGVAPSLAKDRVGYLPEERGLFRNLRVLDTLLYLAELKGRRRAWARQRALALLQRVELEEWAGRKVRDLSRGMQQRLQLVASIVHDPALVFLDEPFQGQDPINVERMRTLISDLRHEGKTIVLSSHQMNLVEALCDRIVLIDHGRAVLYGSLLEIKRRYAPNVVRVRASAIPDGIAGVVGVEGDGRPGGAFNLTLAEGYDPQTLLRELLDRGVSLEAFEVAPAPLADVFVAAVSGNAAASEGR